MFGNRHGQPNFPATSLGDASGRARDAAFRRTRRRDKRAKIAIFRCIIRQVVSAHAARPRYLASERLRFRFRCHPELALQCLGAALILPQRFAAPPGARIGAHQRALTKLGEWIERHQPASGLSRCLMLTRSILLRAQALQDLANHPERAVALPGQPFLEWLRVDIEIGKEFASVQIGGGLEVRPMLRTRQTLEIL